MRQAVNGAEDRQSMEIHWQAEEFPPVDTFGHGVCIFAPESISQPPRMVAFVDGFGWLHRGVDAVVRFDPALFPTGPIGGELRAGIEALMRNRKRRFPGEISPGFPIRVNG
jgi:hypothetical protein